VIADALKNQEISIIVGGTGFYVDSLYRKIDTIGIPPSFELRAKLDKKSVSELQKILHKINPERILKMNASDINNKLRLVRAIEISKSKQKSSSNVIFNPDEILFVGLKADMDKIRIRIEARIKERLEAGAFDEAQSLFTNYDKLSKQIKTSNGYEEFFDFLKGDLNKGEVKQKWLEADYQHAKNQMTWFSKNPQINWFDISEKNFREKAFKIVEKEFAPGRE
jgi:tRNA dimethylallyltransferase